jgi:hypothetical protein
LVSGLVESLPDLPPRVGKLELVLFKLVVSLHFSPVLGQEEQQRLVHFWLLV